jgi:23S rRNA (cytidine2498-2'-O)-methyltransferase
MTSRASPAAEIAGRSEFVFTACNPDSQASCKHEMATNWPELSLAFSRPGFLTWKCARQFPPRFDLSLTFARTFGWSLHSLSADSPATLLPEVISASRQLNCQHIHVWTRGAVCEPGQRAPDGQLAVSELQQLLAGESRLPPVNHVAGADQNVLDVILIDPGRWWLGWHVSGSIPQRWPGGIPPLQPPPDMISRAWLKTAEALLWSGISVKPGDVCAEIGSAPGGSCQRLLQSGATVLAIDPADLDPAVAGHPAVTHLRMRGRDVPHRRLSKVKWLLVDSNVTPAQTLDTVEGLTLGKQTRFRGMLITLKYSQPGRFDELNSIVQRVQSWGYSYVKTRQLAYARQEVCLMALRHKSVRRFRD